MVDAFQQSSPELLRTMIDHFTASDGLGESDEIPDTIAFLCSRAARFCHGAALVVDGGDRGWVY
jgi:NAD(P)-dependent dehydrogenase (short-subunit alcohol dehydrogenase family)